MNLEIKLFWIISILTSIILIYMLLNIIFNFKLRKKIGRKSILKRISLIIVFYLIFLFFTIFDVYNFYNLKNIVEHSSMSEYIKDYKLSGTDYCVVTMNGDEEFEKLDNKTKLAYMVDLNTISTIAIGDILFDGRIPYKIYHESKVIVIVNDNTYVSPNEEKSIESKLYINGELVCEESLEETFRNIKEIKNSNKNYN